MHNITRTIRHLEIEIIPTRYNNSILNLLTGVPLPYIRIKVGIAQTFVFKKKIIRYDDYLSNTGII